MTGAGTSNNIPAAEIHPGCASSCPPKERGQGMPGAGCTRSLVCEVKKQTSVVTTGRRTVRHSLRNGVTAYSVLSPVKRAFLPPSPVDLGVSAARPASYLNKLIPSVAETGPHGLTVRIDAFVSGIDTSITSRTTCRDDRDTPSAAGGTAHLNTTYDFRKQEYFCVRGWTR